MCDFYIAVIKDDIVKMYLASSAAQYKMTTMIEVLRPLLCTR